MEVGQMGTKRAGANVFHIRNGRVRKLILYWDRDNAFADLGLKQQAMSQQNVEIVRAIFRGWNDAGVEGMLPFFHEEFEYLPNEEGGSVYGHDALRRYFERWSEAWDNFDFGPTEFLDAGDYVFVGVTMNGRGRGSGVEVRMEGWQVWLIRGEKAARCEEYGDRAEALEAAGLSEQDAHADP